MNLVDEPGKARVVWKRQFLYENRGSAPRIPHPIRADPFYVHPEWGTRPALSGVLRSV